MALTDREKWDRKYLETPALLRPRPPTELIARFAGEGRGRHALDLACGTGRNTIALARSGWRVEAIDISPVALQILTQRAQEAGVWSRIDTEMIDLDRFDSGGRRYDLMLMCNFLDRSLIRRLLPALNSGGLFLVETYMEHPENQRRDANPDYLLRRGELKEIFAEGYETLHYSERWNESFETDRMRQQRIAVRKL